MSHQPFETWLLSDEPLDAEQAETLQAHLSGCGFCRQLAVNWSEVRGAFRASVPLKPAAGFAARWQARLASQPTEEYLKRQRRQSFGLFILSAGIAFLLLLLLVLQLVLVYDSPEQLLFTGVTRAAEWLTIVNLAQELLTTLPFFFLEIVPPVWWAVFAAGTGLLSLIWILSLRRLMQPRRVTS
jgi:hypothetical protein